MRQPMTFLQAKQQFDTWRSAKTSGGRIPDNLWGVVQQLLSDPSNKRSIVTKGLGISTAQLRHKFPDHFTQHKQTKKSPKSSVFVKASLAPLIQATSSMSGIVLERANGIKLNVTAPTNDQFLMLLKLFME